MPLLLPLKNKLDRLLMKKKWNKALRFLKTKPGTQHVLSSVDEAGISSLVIALMNKPPVDIVKLILQINPALSCGIDRLRMTPLHIACRCGASSDVIKVLLERDNGSTASIVDVLDKTPLHYSIEFLCEPIDEVVLELEEGAVQPRFSGVKRQGVRFIMSRSRGSDASFLMSMAQDELQDQLDTIQMLVIASPEIVWFRDVVGNTPIDILHVCKGQEKDGGPKWERADIASSILRESSVALYKQQKEAAEILSHTRADELRSRGNGLEDQKNFGSLDSSSAGDMSMLEVDNMSYNNMDISLCSGDKGANAQKMARRLALPKRDEETEEIESDFVHGN